MNDLSNVALTDHRYSFTCEPIPSLAFFVLVPLFFLGAVVSSFILAVVRSFVFLICFLLLTCLVVSFILWNWVNWRRNKAVVSLFLRSFPDTDLGSASDGQLVKITGVASCGSIALESSYEKATRCIYTSTLLFKRWRLIHGEINLVSTAGKCKKISLHFRKWLQERDLNLSAHAGVLRLREGYVQEGNFLTVMGMFRRENNVPTILQPPEIFSTGCSWRRMLLPAYIDGLILASAGISYSGPTSLS